MWSSPCQYFQLPLSLRTKMIWSFTLSCATLSRAINTAINHLPHPWKAPTSKRLAYWINPTHDHSETCDDFFFQCLTHQSKGIMLNNYRTMKYICKSFEISCTIMQINLRKELYHCVDNNQLGKMNEEVGSRRMRRERGRLKTINWRWIDMRK